MLLRRKDYAIFGAGVRDFWKFGLKIVAPRGLLGSTLRLIRYIILYITFLTFCPVYAQYARIFRISLSYAWAACVLAPRPAGALVDSTG